MRIRRGAPVAALAIGVLSLVPGVASPIRTAAASSGECTHLAVRRPTHLSALRVRGVLACPFNGFNLGPLVAGPEGIWAASSDAAGGEVLRIDPVTLAVRAQIRVSFVGDMVLRDDGLWVLSEQLANLNGADTDLLYLTQIDRHHDAVLRTVRLPLNASHSSDDQAFFAGTDDALWVGLANTPVLAHVRPADAQVVATLPIPGRLDALGANHSTVWAQVSGADAGSSNVMVIDAPTNTVSATIPCGCSWDGRATQLLATARDVWINGGHAVHIDAATRQVTDTRLEAAHFATDGTEGWALGPDVFPPGGLTGTRRDHTPPGLITRLRAGSVQPEAGTVLPLRRRFASLAELLVVDGHTLVAVEISYPSPQGGDASARVRLLRLALS